MDYRWVKGSKLYRGGRGCMLGGSGSDGLKHK